MSLNTNTLDSLTSQQLNVLKLVALGQKETEVATALNIKVKTVKFHKTAIYKTLGVRNSIEAANIYRQLKVERSESELGPEIRNESYALLRETFQRQAIQLAETKNQLVEVSAKLEMLMKKANLPTLSKGRF